MKESATSFPSTDDLSDDEEAFLRSLRDQLLQQTSYVQVAHDNRYLRDQMKENTGAVREILERLADRGYVERRTGRFGAGQTQDIRIPSDRTRRASTSRLLVLATRFVPRNSAGQIPLLLCDLLRHTLDC